MRVKWKVHTPNLLREIMSNPGCAVLRQPVNIFCAMLVELGIAMAK